MTLAAGTIKRIHVNQHVLRENARDGGDRPAVTVQTSKGPHRCHVADIRGVSAVKQSRKPLSCGARIWVETLAEVELITHH